MPAFARDMGLLSSAMSRLSRLRGSCTASDSRLLVSSSLASRSRSKAARLSDGDTLGEDGAVRDLAGLSRGWGARGRSARSIPPGWGEGRGFMSPSMAKMSPQPSRLPPSSLLPVGWNVSPSVSPHRGEPGDGARVGEASAATAAWSAIARIADGAGAAEGMGGGSSAPCHLKA